MLCWLEVNFESQLTLLRYCEIEERQDEREAKGKEHAALYATVRERCSP